MTDVNALLVAAQPWVAAATLVLVIVCLVLLSVKKEGFTSGHTLAMLGTHRSDGGAVANTVQPYYYSNAHASKESLANKNEPPNIWTPGSKNEIDKYLNSSVSSEALISRNDLTTSDVAAAAGLTV